MRMPQDPAPRWALAAIAWSGAIIGGHALPGLARSASPPKNTPVSTPNEALDVPNHGSAAARLLDSVGPNTPIETKVTRLIDQLVLGDYEQVQTAVTALTMLGPAAVPAIIRRMDDRRDMPVRGIAFANRSPNSFEGLRHYGVAKVVDCLDAVLNDITGESFGSIDLSFGPHGPDPTRLREHNAQRSTSVAAWRGYLAHLQATPRPPTKSLPVAG